MKKYILTLCTVLVFILNFKNVEAISDFSGGTSSGGSIGSGSWLSRYVGLKVSIVSSTNVLKETKIFVNSSGIAGKISHQALKPKTKQSKQISWVGSSNLGTNLITKTTLPSAWMDSNENNINIYDKLSASNYRILLDMLNSFTMKSPGDYILVEPMVYIGGYYGTAFELGNDFMNSSYDNSFADTYKRRLFSGNSSMKSGGLFYTTIYLTSDVTPIGLSVFRYSKNDLSETRKFKERNDCLLSQNCGRGIGVFKYDDIYTGKLKIVKKEVGTTKNIAGAGFTLYSDSSCSKIIKTEQLTNSNGEVIFTNLATGRYYYKETKVPSGYIGDNNCRLANVTNGSTTTISANNEKIVSEGNLEIYIKNNATKQLIQNANSQASYDIYKGQNCSGTKITTVNTRSGLATINNLGVGAYSIKEVKAPKNYKEKTDKCVKKNVQISANSITKETIFYDSSCEARLAEWDGSVSSLIELYKEFGSRGLLDFTNPSCDINVSCPNISPTNLDIGCLSGSLNHASFTEQNLSCYSDKITNTQTGEILGFCVDTFQLKNNLNETNFYSTSGQFIIRKNANNKIQFYKNKNELIEIDNPYVATANVGKICYMLNGNVPPKEKTQRLSLKVYFGNNNIDDDDVVDVDELSYIKNSLRTPPEYVNNGFVRYNYTDTYNYNLNTVYLERLTGKVVNKKNGVIEEVGIVIPFKPIKDEQKYIPFKLSYNNQIFSSDACKYESELEIIKYPADKKNGKIDLEFRLINLKTPFLNERGEIRATNSNWCDFSAPKKEQCNANNNVVIESIINAPDSYGRNSTGPIYSIELTSSDIQKIRKYNKDTPYDNYENYCVKDPELGESCSNSFLYGLKKGEINRYKGNNLKKQYGLLSNPLIFTTNSNN